MKCSALLFRGIPPCLDKAVSPCQEALIVQSDNGKNLAGKQTKLLLPHVCSAAGLKLLAYFHNEAQSGKDICDTYFSHQQTRWILIWFKGMEGGRYQHLNSWLLLS